jgi:hypothetical protein
MFGFSGLDKGWKLVFHNSNKGAAGNQLDFWLIDGELPTSTRAACSLMKSSLGCGRAKISSENLFFVFPSQK